MATAIRIATDADFAVVFGYACPYPWNGLVAERDGRIVGLGGVAWRPDGAYAFLDCALSAMPPPIRAHKLARMVLGCAFRAGAEVIYANPEKELPTARKWLKALGFVYSHTDEVEVWACRALKS